MASICSSYENRPWKLRIYKPYRWQLNASYWSTMWHPSMHRDFSQEKEMWHSQHAARVQNWRVLLHLKVKMWPQWFLDDLNNWETLRINWRKKPRTEMNIILLLKKMPAINNCIQRYPQGSKKLRGKFMALPPADQDAAGEPAMLQQTYSWNYMLSMLGMPKY